MGKRITGAIIGALLVFMWGFVFHTFLPTRDTGISRIDPTQEAAFSAALRATVSDPGFYFFPDTPGSKYLSELSPEELRQYDERFGAGPSGILILRPIGEPPMSSESLGIQFCTCLLGALLSTFVLAHVVAGYGRRVLITTALGLFAWVSVSVPYWNWYAFPLDYTLAMAAEQVVGWLLGGLAIAAFAHHPRYNEE